MKKRDICKIILSITLFLSIIITVNVVLSLEDNYNDYTVVKAQSQVRKVVSYNNPEIKNEFYKIAKRKYDVKNYNCKHKSEAFAKFLIQKGAQDVKICTIAHKSRKYSHEVVVWDDNVYDATSSPSFYSVPSKKYFDMLKKYGFIGLRITTSYPRNN